MKWIHAFPGRIRADEKSFILDLNSIHRAHFELGYPVHYKFHNNYLFDSNSHRGHFWSQYTVC